MRGTAGSHLPRLGGSVALAGLVHLLPLRAEREWIDAARAIEREDAIQVVDLMLQQLCHRPLERPPHLVLLSGDGERIPQIVRNEPRRGGLGVLDPLAADPQDRIAQLANASYGHGPPIWGFGGAVQLAITSLHGSHRGGAGR